MDYYGKREKRQKKSLKIGYAIKEGVLVTSAQPGFHTQAMGLKNS